MQIAALIFAPKNEVSVDNAYPILVLGESTSQRLVDGTDWPSQLEKQLNRNFKAVVYNEAHSATTTPTILTKLPSYISNYKPKLIITMMGVNDNAHFWPKKFVITDTNNLLTRIKIYKLFRYLSAELDEIYDEQWETSEIKYSNLHFPGYSELIASLNAQTYKSAGYNALVNRIENFLIDKTVVEKAQFYASIATDIESDYPEKNSNFHKKLDFFLASSRFDNRIKDASNYALHFALLSGQPEYCQEIIEAAKKARLRMNESFLLRAALCLHGKKDEIAQLFKDAGDIYEYRPDATETPTVESYLKLASYIKNKDICWIVMEYPNREISKPIREVIALQSDSIFPLSNYHVFQNALKTHEIKEIFTDNFGTVFGHATEFGNSLIANNVFELIEELKKNSRCGL